MFILPVLDREESSGLKLRVKPIVQVGNQMLVTVHCPCALCAGEDKLADLLPEHSWSHGDRRWLSQKSSTLTIFVRADLGCPEHRHIGLKKTPSALLIRSSILRAGRNGEKADHPEN